MTRHSTSDTSTETLTLASLGALEKPGCKMPSLGRRLTLQLEAPNPKTLPDDLEEHLRHCLACQLERRNFEAALREPKTPGVGFRARVGWTLRSTNKLDPKR